MLWKAKLKKDLILTKSSNYKYVAKLSQTFSTYLYRRALVSVLVGTQLTKEGNGFYNNECVFNIPYHSKNLVIYVWIIKLVKTSRLQNYMAILPTEQKYLQKAQHIFRNLRRFNSLWMMDTSLPNNWSFSSGNKKRRSSLENFRGFSWISSTTYSRMHNHFPDRLNMWVHLVCKFCLTIFLIRRTLYVGIIIMKESQF